MRQDIKRTGREMRDKERRSGTRVKSESDKGERERDKESVAFYLAPKGREERRVRTPVQDL